AASQSALTRASPLPSLEQQRFDDDRNHIGHVDDAPDVDIVELLEVYAVDRNDMRARRGLVPDDATETHADVTIDQQDEQQAHGDRFRQGIANPPRHGVKPRMERITTPGE